MTDDDHPSLAAVLAYVRDVLGRSKLNASQQAVALLVASHYNRREGCARPSQGCLADELGWHEDTVYRALRGVTAAGVWQVEPGTPRRAARYRFAIRAAVHSPRAGAGSDMSTVPALARGAPRASAGSVPALARGEQNNEQEQGTCAPQALADAVPRGDDVPPKKFIGYAL